MGENSMYSTVYAIFIFFTGPFALAVTLALYFSNTPEKRKQTRKIFYIKIFLLWSLLHTTIFIQFYLIYYWLMFQELYMFLCKIIFEYLTKPISVYMISLFTVFVLLIVSFKHFISKMKLHIFQVFIIFILSFIILQCTNFYNYMQNFLPKLLWFLAPNQKYSTMSFFLYTIVFNYSIFIAFKMFFSWWRKRTEK